jgi:hypothetical protein
MEKIFYIPPVLRVWQRTTSQTGVFTTGTNNIHGVIPTRYLSNIKQACQPLFHEVQSMGTFLGDKATKI